MHRKEHPMDPIIFSLGLSTTREGERIRADRELELLRRSRERQTPDLPAARSGRTLVARVRARFS